MEGIKFDNDKRQWDLLPWKELEEVVKVLEHGAKKYSPDNWKYVKPVSRYTEALLRHVIAYAQDEKIDPVDKGGSGLSHLAHAICCCLFLMWNDNNPEEVE